MATTKSGVGKGARKLQAPSSEALIDAAIHPEMLREIVAVLEGTDITRLDWRRVRRPNMRGRSWARRRARSRTVPSLPQIDGVRRPHWRD